VTLDQADITALAAEIRGEVITPNDAAYDEARRVWNSMIDKYPALIARCTGTADVAAAVKWAHSRDLPVAVRGGGHNVAGNAVNDGGIVIDLSRMKGIYVDPVKRTARAQGGAIWGDLDRETQLFGLATPGGEVSMTGIAGYTLSGGMGLLQRKWGMACDNALSAEVVLASSEVVSASASEHPDLYWAIRGGGGNFGAVTSFEFALHPLGPEVFSAAVLYPFAEAPRIMRLWRDFAEQAPDEATVELLFWSLPPLPDLPEELHGAPIIGVAGLYAGSAEEGERALQPMREWGEPVVDFSGVSTYVEAQSGFDVFFPETQRYYWKSLFLDALDDATIDAMIAELGERPSPQALVALRQFGGAVGRVPMEATAYPHRRALYNLSIDTTWDDPADDERMIAWTRQGWQTMHDRAGGGGVYLNFAGLGEENDALAQAGYGANYDRLRQIKANYDPDNVFRGNINVRP
jgi:FAD/FMN-containing dehydrogenase